MGYALFAQRKLVLDNQISATQLQQTQRSNEQYFLATQSSSLQQKLSSLLSSQALELEPLYKRLAESTNQQQRDKIQAEIAAMQNRHKQEEEAINREIYQTGIKETAIEMEVKRLDTQITTLQKQLEAVEEAESAAIDRATPKFKGVG
jgi:hypothetical protein